MGTVVLVSFLFFYFFFFLCFVLSFVAEINELMLAFDEQLLSFHSSSLILDSSIVVRETRDRVSPLSH